MIRKVRCLSSCERWPLANGAGRPGRNSTIIVRVDIPPNVESKKQLIVDIQFKRLKIAWNVSKVSGPETVIDAELSRQVIPDESTWVIEQEGRQRILTVHLAKKVDGENWPTLLKEELSSSSASDGAPGVAKPPKELTEKQRKAREASDLLVLKSWMGKMEAPARAEIQSLLDRGVPPGDVMKLINETRRGAVKR